jgi:hypothetical protein
LEWIDLPSLLIVAPERLLRSPGRVRILAVPSSIHPLEIGEADYFAFDFTPDVGAATIVSTSWNCALGPYETAIDPTPQSRVFSVSSQTAIQIRSPMDGSLQMRTGAFSVGLIGGMPASAAGGNYILEATANLSDGRVLKLNSTVQCKLPGP